MIIGYLAGVTFVAGWFPVPSTTDGAGRQVRRKVGPDLKSRHAKRGCRRLWPPARNR